MGHGKHESVVLVPPSRQADLVDKLHQAVIESEDHNGWDTPNEQHVHVLREFFTRLKSDVGPRKPAQKSWSYSVGLRVGYNRTGFYIHQDHLKRYFGIPRAEASVLLNNEVPEGVPLCVPQVGRSDTQNLLGKLAKGIPAINDDLREKVLKATFSAADINGNGYLSRPELGKLLMRMCGNMKAEDVEREMKEAHPHSEKGVAFDEFMVWLKEKAPPKFHEGIKKAHSTAPDIVRASFRIWDTNGDGIMQKKDIYRCMHSLNPVFKKENVDVFMVALDGDHDGHVDYDEFVDYLFYK